MLSLVILGLLKSSTNDFLSPMFTSIALSWGDVEAGDDFMTWVSLRVLSSKRGRHEEQLRRNKSLLVWLVIVMMTMMVMTITMTTAMIVMMMMTPALVCWWLFDVPNFSSVGPADRPEDHWPKNLHSFLPQVATCTAPSFHDGSLCTWARAHHYQNLYLKQRETRIFPFLGHFHDPLSEK